MTSTRMGWTWATAGITSAAAATRGTARRRTTRWGMARGVGTGTRWRRRRMGTPSSRKISRRTTPGPSSPPTSRRRASCASSSTPSMSSSRTPCKRLSMSPPTSRSGPSRSTTPAVRPSLPRLSPHSY
ncbi:DNA-directed RNA polymerase II subunit 2 [Zea mays]|uniref:DNA-directed RNA polymerase II subunit 2 n=1 Tax=Zea mays TaxID=4577 RepID=A0A1D6GLH9_MAIZE|nr:DNA-directed RNA polymerase II subunit 2 [Zea mays]